MARLRFVVGGLGEGFKIFVASERLRVVVRVALVQRVVHAVGLGLRLLPDVVAGRPPRPWQERRHAHTQARQHNCSIRGGRCGVRRRAWLHSATKLAASTHSGEDQQPRHPWADRNPRRTLGSNAKRIRHVYCAWPTCTSVAQRRQARRHEHAGGVGERGKHHGHEHVAPTHGCCRLGRVCGTGWMASQVDATVDRNRV